MPARIRLHDPRKSGSPESDSGLPVIIYNQLRILARKFMKNENGGNALQPTALVNEAYLRIVRGKTCEITSKTQFFRFAARAMREILIDDARARMSLKRGGALSLVTLPDDFPSVSHPQELLGLDEALKTLEEIEPQAARVVEMRFFGGMVETEIASELDISVSAVKREWSFARAWLKSQLNRV